MSSIILLVVIMVMAPVAAAALLYLFQRADDQRHLRYEIALRGWEADLREFAQHRAAEKLGIDPDIWVDEYGQACDAYTRRTAPPRLQSQWEAMTQALGLRVQQDHAREFRARS
jgi:hypothetical protein